MPRQGPGCHPHTRAGLILPHRTVPGGPMGEIRPVSSPTATTAYVLVTGVKLVAGPAVVGAGPYDRPMSGSAPGPPGSVGAAARETAWEAHRRRSRVYPPER